MSRGGEALVSSVETSGGGSVSRWAPGCGAGLPLGCMVRGGGVRVSVASAHVGEYGVRGCGYRRGGRVDSMGQVWERVDGVGWGSRLVSGVRVECR